MNDLHREWRVAAVLTRSAVAPPNGKRDARHSCHVDVLAAWVRLDPQAGVRKVGRSTGCEEPPRVCYRPDRSVELRRTHSLPTLPPADRRPTLECMGVEVRTRVR